jgi:hypothetical protein
LLALRLAIELGPGLRLELALELELAELVEAASLLEPLVLELKDIESKAELRHGS